MIEKPTIIVTSLGRTGTKFFAELFDNIILEATSLHEPDIFNFSLKKGKGIDYLKKQIQESDFKNLILKKALGKWSLVQISDKKFCNQISTAQAIKKLVEQRKEFIESRPGRYYIESNVGYYGLLDILPHTFVRHKAVYIVRDGRDWVASNMKWGEMYGKGKIRSLVAHNWPEAKDISEDEYYNKWDELSRFEKLCWAWSRLNKYAIDRINENPNATWSRFEDIFFGEHRYENLKRLIEFLTDMGHEVSMSYLPFDGWLEKKIHSNTGYYPDWANWSSFEQQSFEEICGDLMIKFGYKI